LLFVPDLGIKSVIVESEWDGNIFYRAGKEALMEIQEYFKDGFVISTAKEKLQLEEIYAFLGRSYWAENRSKEKVALSLQHSFCFGVYKDQRQMGFARVVTDYSTFAYLCDVYILEEFQNRGLGKWLISVVMSHPELQGFKLWSLVTRDAHGLYRRFGFTELKYPERWMQILDPLQ
jgi:ribosomal protein S18 acetylase RimI-like enzyme